MKATCCGLIFPAVHSHLGTPMPDSSLILTNNLTELICFGVNSLWQHE